MEAILRILHLVIRDVNTTLIEKPAKRCPLATKIFLTLSVMVVCRGQSYLEEYCSIEQKAPLKSSMSLGQGLIKMTLSFNCLLRRIITMLLLSKLLGNGLKFCHGDVSHYSLHCLRKSPIQHNTSREE